MPKSISPAHSLLDQPNPWDAVPLDLQPSDLLQDAGPLDPAARIVTPEIVGNEPKPPMWRRAVDRAMLGAVMGAIGLGLIVVGVLLTATIIGALVGIPIALLGLALLFVAVVAPFARAHVWFVSLGRPSGDSQPVDEVRA
jgi:hypothetical protein